MRRLALLALLLALPTNAQQSKPDLSREPTLYVIGYAHLDTQWRWEYPQSIAEYLPRTLHDNFALFEKYPHYVFNFSGANRYRMMKEYFPADYERMRGYVRAGRWFPSGSMMEEIDVNTPSAESIVRQVLYGSRFFQRELERTSAEVMLPDTFGFPSSLPTILSHSGIRGFSTQKLTWGSAASAGGENSIQKTPKGIPFNVGLWEGPDGSTVIAAFNPGSYSADITHDVSASPPPGARNAVDWPARIARNGSTGGVFADYHYYGVGDIGGAPREPSVALVEAIVTKGRAAVPPSAGGTASTEVVEVGHGPVRVISSNAERMFLDIPRELTRGLPRFKGELELTNHSAGSITSQSAHKQWNRRNELLADAAERASVVAAWLGAAPYPQQRLTDAWTLVMGGQFHDNQAGTSTPKAYEFTWNDDLLAMNQFGAVLTSAVEAVASEMDTRVAGVPLVVYNPLEIDREDVVEATLPLWGAGLPGGAGVPPASRPASRRAAEGHPKHADFPASETLAGDARSPRAIRVIGPDGKSVPSQILEKSARGTRIAFLARVPAVGFTVYDVRASDEPEPSSLKASASAIENARYRISLDAAGDVASIFDKQLEREILSAPARLAIQTETPSEWPAWNMDWDDRQKPPRAYVGGTPQVRIVEAGPARVAVQVTRGIETEGCGPRAAGCFVQTIRLAAGDSGNRVEFDNDIEWKGEAASLKATFPLTASNPKATYNWGVGTIERGNNDEKKFEVASHQWIDLTDRSGAFGTTILTGSRYGSDKPDDNTLRLTLLYTPGLGGGASAYADQTSQDWGRHRFVYGVASHASGRNTAEWHAARLEQPLIAFQSSAKHDGNLGRTFSFLRISTPGGATGFSPSPNVRVMALKKAEASNDLILRVVGTGSDRVSATISFAGRVEAEGVVDGRELTVCPPPEICSTQLLEPPKLRKERNGPGTVRAELRPGQIRTLALQLAPRRTPAVPVAWAALELPFDLAVSSRDGARTDLGFDRAGRALPAEMLPKEIVFGRVRFRIQPEGRNALVARGQTISIPNGRFTRVHLLAASSPSKKSTRFLLGDEPVHFVIEPWRGYVGQWFNRTWVKQVEDVPARAGAPPNAPTYRRAVTKVASLEPSFFTTTPVGWYASHHHDAAGKNQPYDYAQLFVTSADLPAGARTITLPDDPSINIMAITVSDERGSVRLVQPLDDMWRNGL